MEFVRSFQHLGRGDLAAAGGKGANLGTMTQAGLPVPPGFVLLTDAYRLFVQQAGIQGDIEQLAGAVDPNNQTSLDTTSARIRSLFDQGDIPGEVAAAVAAAYAVLGEGSVAVRSSATAEDLPDASFAGQQETYLNISGVDPVLQAVRRCWSSLWTGRALAYRRRNDIASGDVALAVVVQQLIAADVAGVLFTADPISGRRDRMVIDGAWGLGEAVVSGSVSPDHWLADGRTGAILAEQVATKTVMTVRIAGGSAEQPVPVDLQRQPVLKAAQVAALVDLGRATAAYFGAPQDMEWAIADGQVYLLQSRPITTLFPLPAPAPPPSAGLRVYANLGPMQGVMEPLTPAGVAMLRILMTGAVQFVSPQAAPGPPAFFTVAGGRIFPDLTGILGTPLVSSLVGGNLIDAATQQALQDLVSRNAQRWSAVGGGRHPAKQIRKWVLLTVLGRALSALINPAAARRRARRDVEAHVNALAAESGRLQTLSDRVQFVHRAVGSIFARVAVRSMPLAAPALAMRGLIERKLKAWGIDPARLDPVGRSISHNPTTDMDLALWRLACTLKSEGVLPRADHPAVQAWLAEYGHRTVREIDIGIPRWQENSEPVLQMLSGYIAQSATGTDPEHHFQKGAAAAEAAIAALTAEVRRTHGAVKAALLRFGLHRFRELVGIREWHKFYLLRIFVTVRRVLSEVGAELIRAGRLDRADDVFFLDVADLDPADVAAAADLRPRVAHNRAEYERELKRHLVPLAMTSAGEVSYGMPSAREGMLVGTGASAGIYEGVVRIIHNPVGAGLEAGEILVAPGTDPAWTPLFLTAGALVAETGGMMSHGSVVAREYGIPAVVGVSGATTTLRTGQRIRVDGGSGTVVPLD